VQPTSKQGQLCISFVLSENYHKRLNDICSRQLCQTIVLAAGQTDEFNNFHFNFSACNMPVRLLCFSTNWKKRSLVFRENNWKGKEMIYLVAILLYLLFLTGVGLYRSRQVKTGDDFSVAGRTL